MLPTFSEITQAWQCLKIVFIRSDEFKGRIPIFSISVYIVNQMTILPRTNYLELMTPGSITRHD